MSGSSAAGAVLRRVIQESPHPAKNSRQQRAASRTAEPQLDTAESMRLEPEFPAARLRALYSAAVALCRSALGISQIPSNIVNLG